jgi:hypothetical protein
MNGVITTSGSAWAAAGGDIDPIVEVLAIRTFRGRRSQSAVVARSSAEASAMRNGNDLAIHFTATIPVIDTSEGRFSWNVQLETSAPQYRTTFLIDVA